MRLYHYTGKDHLSGILSTGLTMGAFPIFKGEETRVTRGYQWLTSDPSWAQIWATQNHIHCDRTQARLQLAVPKAHRQELIRWSDLAPALPPDTVESLRRPGFDQHWWIYRGRIPPSWIRGIEFRP